MKLLTSDNFYPKNQIPKAKETMKNSLIKWTSLFCQTRTSYFQKWEETSPRIWWGRNNHNYIYRIVSLEEHIRWERFRVRINSTELATWHHTMLMPSELPQSQPTILLGERGIAFQPLAFLALTVNHKEFISNPQSRVYRCRPKSCNAKTC